MDHDARKLNVLVERFGDEEDLHHKDLEDSPEGVHGVLVDPMLDDADAASQALVEFHAVVPISRPEDFAYWVLDPDTDENINPREDDL